MTLQKRIEAIDWERLLAEVDSKGFARTGQLLNREELSQLVGCYDDDRMFRSQVTMARHGFGAGEYRYFAYPLPPLVQELRWRLYERLAPLANRWIEELGLGEPVPLSFEDYIFRCHAAGQSRPTPLILRYGPGDFNRLHQDLYGPLHFPLQAAFLLNEPGVDFTGGELVLTEQRPRTQSRVEVVPLERGEAVIFAVNHRPVTGRRGSYRVAMRHGVSPLREGRRHALGIIFHDAA
ncbi:MAG: 2OG-Fe(II) oxygenase [Sphingomonas sp.]|nr:2OG-Fe(II) oxygenase [Sphingomonas sp.]